MRSMGSCWSPGTSTRSKHVPDHTKGMPCAQT